MTGYVSRPHTPAYALSGWTWQQGPTAFFSQSVPFSYGIGPLLAKRIWQAYESPVREGPLTGLEIGAGLGYLSKQCLDAAPVPIAHWIVSDGSEALVSHWQRCGLFASHDAVQMAVVDFSCPLPQQLPDDIDLIVMSYVLDSVPTCHVCWEGGVLYEYMVATVMPDTPVFCPSPDTSVGLVPMPAADVWAAWDTYSDPIRPWLAAKLGPLCQETWARRPVSESTYLSSEDAMVLRTFFEAHPCEGPVYFNYAPVLRTQLPELLAHVSDTGIFALHDFGYHCFDGAPNVESLCTRFGSIQAYALYFPFIVWLAQQHGFHAVMAAAPEGGSTLCVISKYARRAWLHHAHVTADMLQHHVDSLSSEKVPLETVDTAALALTEDYAWLAHMGETASSPESALPWLRLAIDLYPDLAIPSYAQYGSRLIELGQFLEAEQVLVDACERFPHDPTLAVSLANVYIRLKKWDQARQLLAQVIPRTDAPLGLSLEKMYRLLTQQDFTPKMG